MSPRAHLVLVLAIGWLAAIPGRASADDSRLHFEAHVEAAHNQLSDRPTETDDPHHVLVIQGRKDPKVELWLGIDFASTHPGCQSQTWFGRLFGAPDLPQVVTDNVRLPAGQDRFEVRFFVDRYASGRCGWQPLGVRHAEFVPGVSDGPSGWGGLIAFSDSGRSEATLAWSCQLGVSGASSTDLDCLTRTRGAGAMRISSQGGTVNVTFELLPRSPLPRGLQAASGGKAIRG
ncbi:hypothetical protein [Burkholderia ubonensis]|uniref:Lipoprotein n=1 Tax=Burkholderia ubonensis subsp. mesacidophila TaxID=265293 RepID=A0A2A4FIV1_9BURK|nr:hypothetical protein [Burkholderia ubonensis]PCE32336.1 hypothetical protein BZL54_10780 [Burkholderia ubonensis subsp. mesacidophila]